MCASEGMVQCESPRDFSPGFRTSYLQTGRTHQNNHAHTTLETVYCQLYTYPNAVLSHIFSCDSA